MLSLDFVVFERKKIVFFFNVHNKFPGHISKLTQLTNLKMINVQNDIDSVSVNFVSWEAFHIYFILHRISGS